MAAEADEYQVPKDWKTNTKQRESLYWVGTHHATNNEKGNYERAWPDSLETYASHGSRSGCKVTYTAGQEEKGGNCDGYHLQFYVEFEKKTKLTTLKNTFSKRIHWEIRKGSAQQADDYVGKDETHVDGGIEWKVGTISKTSPGKRSDLDAIRDDMISGKKRKAIVMENFGTYVRYGRGLENAAIAMGISLDEKQPSWVERKCHIFYGVAGCGKSTAAEKLIGDDSMYQPEQNAQGQLSFESYRGEKWIWIEDFEPKTLTPGMLKRMMDNRPCVLPGRGCSRQAQHIGVIITTNHYPETWVEGAMQALEYSAISRRCQTIWSCKMDKWTIIGGTEFKVGESIDSPLADLVEWSKARVAAQRPEDVETEDETD